MKSSFKVFYHGESIERTEVDYNNQLQVNAIKFSDNTMQIKLENNLNMCKQYKQFTIEAMIVDSDGIIALSQIKDILDFYYKPINVMLIMPYMPYARYDRRMSKNDSFSLQVFCNNINRLNFGKVSVDDPHSLATISMLNNSEIRYSQLNALAQTISHKEMQKYDYIVSPDLGAIKKATDIADSYKLELLVALKKRDVETGYTVFDKLLTDYPESLKNKSVLIVDDICDGGRTFINLAEKLKSNYNISHVDLFVTHGIFSNGYKLDHIDNTYCFNDLKLLMS